MKIEELRKYAEDNGFDSLEFEFTNLSGKVIKGKWLDAYFGLFELDGSNGFITVKTWKEATNDIFEYRILNK